MRLSPATAQQRSPRLRVRLQLHPHAPPTPRVLSGAAQRGRRVLAVPEGLQLRAADEAAEDELQAWLVQQRGVVVDNHGGWAPEQWRGTVDGHSFYFRERGGDWNLEIDLIPTGQSMRIVGGQNDDGTTRYQQLELERGDIIASGTIYSDGYGTTPVERARFIITIIRDHLRRQACAHHPHELDAISAVLGVGVDWCPTCGIRLAPL